MAADRFIHGICIASVTARCYADEHFIDMISIEDEVSFVSNRGYVPISYILPTHIALAGFVPVPARKVGSKNYPMMYLPVNIQNRVGTTRDSWYLSSKHIGKVRRLVMINIDRSRGSCLKDYYDEHARKNFFIQVTNETRKEKPCILKVN
jgi:hypothetical protein